MDLTAIRATSHHANLYAKLIFTAELHIQGYSNS